MNNRIKLLIIHTLFTACVSACPQCVGSRMFYYPEMCNLTRDINDCSFQFSQRNSCYVFEGDKECENYNFSSWHLKPLYKHVTEEDSEFTVSILPYFVYVYDFQKDHPFSAINIILTSRNEAITGFSLMMTENIHKRIVCRIFDFRKSANNISVPFPFSYDCLHQLAERGWKNVSMVFRAYPLNTELNYLVYIPPKVKANSTSVFSWRPLVMVFVGALPNFDIHIKFSNVPEKLKNMFFNVTLVDSFGFPVEHRRIPSSNESEMIACHFHVLVEGYYSVHVGIISEEEPYPVSEMDFFYVGHKIKDYSLILFIISTVVMIFFAGFLIYFSCLWYIKNASPPSKCTVLFVYSYKRLHHEFLVIYSRYLENQYGLKVNMIYEKCGNPKTWLEEKYSESDVMVFVVSPSLQTLDQGIAEGEHHWVDQLAEAKALIDNSYVGRKRICNICFPYSRKEHLPKCLEKQGPIFMLPTDLNPFLCFVFNCPKKLYLVSKLFNRNHHKILNPDTIQTSNDEIEKKLQVIMKTPLRESPVLNVRKTMEENSVEEKTVQPQWSVSHQSSNVVPLADNLTKPSEDRKLNVSLQEMSNETENDDFMMYCIRKILYTS